MRHLALLVLLALTGCVHTRQVDIDSDPSGAVVEFDGNYLGKTPIHTKVTRQVNEWSDRIVASEVTATKAGCTLIKKIGKDVATPRKIFFDFTECRSPGAAKATEDSED